MKSGGYDWSALEIIYYILLNARFLTEVTMVQKHPNHASFDSITHVILSLPSNHMCVGCIQWLLVEALTRNSL